jgi:Asp-tRNA(Asn)/Glu-tRNA(Gln) amidotransferase A subunit family amidase
MSTAPTAGVDDLVHEPIAALADRIRHGRLRSVELVESYLSRIEARNPSLNAIVAFSQTALKEAAEVDDAVRRGEDPGPMCGIPFTVKDTILTAGLCTTAGSVLLKGFIPTETAPAVRRVQHAGGILVGKTNTPEFALDLHTDNVLFGATINPADPSLTPGGSSGGECAAVSAGLSAFGIGTDFGASLRWPAQCTGVVSLRPTVGRVPGSGALPYFSARGVDTTDPDSFFAQTQVVGPIARTVDDLWLALKTMSGPDPSDPVSRSVDLGDPAHVVPSDLNCAWFASDATYEPDEDVLAVIRCAAETLARCGISITQQRPAALDRAERVYNQLRLADNATWMARLPTNAQGERPPFIQAAIEESRSMSSAAIQSAAAERVLLRSSLERYMMTTPILLTAVSRKPAFPVTDLTTMPVPSDIVSPCRSIGLFGLPVVSIPFGRSAQGAFISVQVVGRPFADHQVLAVASLLERYRPPLHRQSLSSTTSSKPRTGVPGHADR